MNIDELMSYQDVVTYLKSKNRTKHLLFGNGFSMAYDPGIFSYNALSNFIEKIDDDLLKQLFSTLNTKNFELIMQQLDSFAEIAKIFSSDSDLVSKIEGASYRLKNSLIDAVKELHPEHVFTIPEEKCKHCFSFLQSYLENGGFVFSTNYDLLPYWVLLRNHSDVAVDGFGRDLENDGEEFTPEQNREYSELRWGKYKESQTVFYLHGALPFFDNGIDIIKETYTSQHYLLDNIKARMEKKEYPIFVTAGDGKQKLNHIMHNKYLSYCYDKLTQIEGSLVTFGFNFGDYDDHLIEAVNKAAHHGKKSGGKLFSIYIGVYSNEGLQHIEKIRKKFKFKVNIYNAKTLNIWGH